jgi:hypothetical protein
MTKLLAIALALSLTACVDEAAPTDESTDVDTTEREAAGEPADLCSMLPAPTDAGDACSHLCDEEGIASFIPAGTCVTFVCHLTDGSTYRTGGCAP